MILEALKMFQITKMGIEKRKNELSRLSYKVAGSSCPHSELTTGTTIYTTEYNMSHTYVKKNTFSN